MRKDREFSALLGEEITLVSGMEEDSNRIEIHTKTGRTFEMFHSQDCCETVWLEDVVGDPRDLLGKVLAAYESSNRPPQSDYNESETWTFYRIITDSGGVALRWVGSSNGYYSEDVDFVEVIGE